MRTKRIRWIASVVSVLFIFICLAFRRAAKVSAQTVNLSETEKSYVTQLIPAMAEDEGIVPGEFSYTAALLYLVSGREIGYVVDFTFGKRAGFTLLVGFEQDMQAAEVDFNGHSPFYEEMGKYVYPAPGKYYAENGGAYFDLTTRQSCPRPNTEDPDRFYAAAGSDQNVPESEDILYGWGHTSSYTIPNMAYYYNTDLTSQPNNCADAAGVILLNYWNRYYNNNLLNLKTDFLWDGDMTEAAAQEFMELFYFYMKTNWIFGAGGTLPMNLYAGFNTLITLLGHHTKTTTMGTYDEMKEKLKQNIPIVIVSDDYYFTPIFQSLPSPISTGGKLHFEYEHTWGLIFAHAFIAYGYLEYSLYRYQPLTDARPYSLPGHTDLTLVYFTQRFLKIADGWGSYRYFNYLKSKILSTKSVEVYL